MNNFDFLQNINKELFEIINDAQKLFRDEYFNQSVVQVRIFAEKTARLILGVKSENLSFDDTLNCLKDKIKTEREKEFIDDLFFIKKEGNKCAHGETVSATVAMEVIERAFEVSINYACSKKKDEKIAKLRFDKTLLITGKAQKEIKMADKYIEAANKEFDNKYASQPVEEKPKQKTKKNDELIKQKVKEKVKIAKKNLKNTVNKKPRKQTKKELNIKKKKKKALLKLILFLTFVTISLIFITKMLFFF